MAALLFPLTVTNFTRHSVSSLWRVRVVDPADLQGDPVFNGLKAKPLPVVGFGLIEHRCDQFRSRKDAKPAHKLELKLEAGTRAGIALVVDTKKVAMPGRLQIALFAIEEERSDGLTGGVLVAVTSNGGAFVVPTEVLAPKPVPLALVDGPCLQADTLFRKGPVHTAFDRTAGGGFLGFLVRNTGTTQLRSVVFYPESISLAGIQWDSHVFEIDALAPGEEFFAAFPFNPSTAEEGEGRIRMVGYSAGYDRTRLDVMVSVFDPHNR